MNVLDELAATLLDRRDADPATSYVATLYAEGLDRILKKVGEEAAEVIMAAKNAERGGSQEDLVKEVADLWFHSMVMLVHLELDHTAVLNELARRFGTSGHEEKRSRR